MIPADTDPAAWAFYLDTLRQMGPEGRSGVTFALCDTVRETAREGIRSRHPDYDDHMAQRALVRLLLGDELFKEACPTDPFLAP